MADRQEKTAYEDDDDDDVCRIVHLCWFSLTMAFWSIAISCAVGRHDGKYKAPRVTPLTINQKRRNI